jgi:hypothetical protein
MGKNRAFFAVSLGRRWLSRFREWRFGLAFGLALWPWPAWAIQTHAHPEGLYAHQMGHVAFLGAMIYVCWQIWRSHLLSRPGFRHLFWACILFGCWNVLTFCGHWAEEGLDPGAIDRQGGHLFRQLHITDLGGLIYYLASLDHLILIPAFWLFYLGLKDFLAGQQKELAQR